MNETVNEKKYPVEKKWLLKPIINSSIRIIFFSLILSYIKLLNAFNQINIFIMLIIIFETINFISVYLWILNYHYSIEDEFLTIKKGTIKKQQRSISFGVIQNIILKQGIFDRFFNLASLQIENASQTGGLSANKNFIPGLTKENAEIIKGILFQKIKDNPRRFNQSGL